MYDLIASWMTTGGPLQELRRDDRGRIQDVRPTAKPAVAPERRTRRLSFGFARGPRADQTLLTGCADGCAAC